MCVLQAPWDTLVLAVVWDCWFSCLVPNPALLCLQGVLGVGGAQRREAETREELGVIRDLGWVGGGT